MTTTTKLVLLSVVLLVKHIYSLSQTFIIHSDGPEYLPGIRMKCNDGSFIDNYQFTLDKPENYIVDYVAVDLVGLFFCDGLTDVSLYLQNTPLNLLENIYQNDSDCSIPKLDNINRVLFSWKDDSKCFPNINYNGINTFTIETLDFSSFCVWYINVYLELNEGNKTNCDSIDVQCDRNSQRCYQNTFPVNSLDYQECRYNWTTNIVSWEKEECPDNFYCQEINLPNHNAICGNCYFGSSICLENNTYQTCDQINNNVLTWRTIGICQDGEICLNTTNNLQCHNTTDNCIFRTSKCVNDTIYHCDYAFDTCHSNPNQVICDYTKFVPFLKCVDDISCINENNTAYCTVIDSTTGLSDVTTGFTVVTTSSSTFNSSVVDTNSTTTDLNDDDNEFISGSSVFVQFINYYILSLLILTELFFT